MKQRRRQSGALRNFIRRLRGGEAPEAGLFGEALARVAALALVVACTVCLQAGPAAAEKVRIRVAGAQIPVVRDVAKNVETLTRAIAYAVREKADVLVTPEGSLSGYYAGFDAAATERGLEPILEQARAAKLALVLGTCFAAKDGRRYDAQRFYDQAGRYVGFHAKILLCRRKASSSLCTPSKSTHLRFPTDETGKPTITPPSASGPAARPSGRTG